MYATCHSFSTDHLLPFPTPLASTTAATIASTSHTVSSYREPRRGAMVDVDSLSDLLKLCGLESDITPSPEVTLRSIDSKLEAEGRPAALNFLKDNGVDKLGPRQRIINEFSKAKREGRLHLNASAAATAHTDGAAGSGMDAAAKAAVLARMAGVPQPAETAVDLSDASPANSAPVAAAAPTPAVGQFRWLVDISCWEPGPAEWQLLLKQLPEEDSTKVMRFKFVADQKRALVSRFLQRRACAEATGVAWSQVSITRTKGGKPFMTNKPSPPTASGLHANWNFNVSHEGKYVALAAEPRLVCGVDVAAPEEARAGTKKKHFDDTLNLMKGQMAPQEWGVIQSARPDEHRMEECFRKFWSLKEAYTKGRGDGLGFEFNRTDFRLGDEGGKGLAGQSVQLASVLVDGKKLPNWGFHIQPLEADHWVSTGRGPPTDIVDAHGTFTKTFGETRPPPDALAAELALPEPPYEMKKIAELVADDVKGLLAKAQL